MEKRIMIGLRDQVELLEYNHVRSQQQPKAFDRIFFHAGFVYAHEGTIDGDQMNFSLHFYDRVKNEIGLNVTWRFEWNGKRTRPCLEEFIRKTIEIEAEDPSIGAKFSLPLSEVISMADGGSLLLRVVINVHHTNGLKGPLKRFDISNSECSDCIVQVEEEEFYVSKSYLLSQCPKLFYKTQPDRLKVYRVHPTIFQDFLEVLHAVPGSIMDHNIGRILSFAFFCGARTVLEKCEHYLLNAESNIKLREKLNLSNDYQLEELQDSLVDRITDAKFLESFLFEKVLRSKNYIMSRKVLDRMEVLRGEPRCCFRMFPRN
ncbi:hypothetical protein L5515_002189 [Caenorhabditis briggsae]|uniref:BTB domain-containing protein n=1 Tax=Caenorhabditis briggsae TaxID=6238 RepID=A0AAE9E3H0_CAEBR|nr:hypothetical protein L3Y34_016121 [Caenorhabditis briggsae]UMM14355.1 hypothetical protein L5515_002189 [Caenorhabditis briggsae]